MSYNAQLNHLFGFPGVVRFIVDPVGAVSELEGGAVVGIEFQRLPVVEVQLNGIAGDFGGEHINGDAVQVD